MFDGNPAIITTQTKHKNMNLKEYQRIYNVPENSAPGWDAIDQALLHVYGKNEPKHFGTIEKYMSGGPDPLDGVSVYTSNNSGIRHQHFISYGMTNLYYDEEAVGSEFSGFGFEFTFRLKVNKDLEETYWPINLMQNLARYVFSSGNLFEPGHFMPANGPIALDTDTDTELWAVCFVQDPEINSIISPHGLVQFLQIVGITQAEYDALQEKRISVQQLLERLSENNPLLITDLRRKSIV